MIEDTLNRLSLINELEILIPISILAVMLIAISKSGFGGGLGGLGFPLIVLVLPPKLALAVFLPLTLLIDIWIIFIWRKFFIFEIIWMMVLGGMIGQIFGWIFFNYFDDKSILIIVGTMALIASIKFFSNKLDFFKNLKNPVEKLTPNYLRSLILCFFSGFASFVAWAGSAPAQIYLLKLKLNRKNFVGIMSFYFFLINFSKIPFYMDLNIFTSESLVLSFLLIPVLPIGIFLGKWLNLKLSDYLFYYISHVALFFCGIHLLIKNIF